ncbi:MAG: glycogen/starch synthase [Bacteroidales bacterium]|jgi:starch synthase|nr:glycogen/starch synthase [Bacteroidales bacterium]MBQ1937394.1 glycogen/starch synthase [Bacteroidales bacterium]MBQ2452530.1 glycogen/starch synthase [Bacteroidales bacterium]
MGDIKRVLFVNSEIFPYLPESPIANIGRQLPQGIQERKKEIRSFMPRYGCINERKNQLHEVIRLSGMNLIIGDVDRPLIIKVASLPVARTQVYFIDNEDYFQRKASFTDADGVSFADNAERAVFFARGVLEAVKKMRWAPDLIHCQGWITHLIPLYLKKSYYNDPIFSSCRVVLSLYDDLQKEPFQADFASKALIPGCTQEDLALLENPTSLNLAKIAAQYSDGIILGSENCDPELCDFCRGIDLPLLEYNKEAIENGSYIDDYNQFYEQF